MSEKHFGDSILENELNKNNKKSDEILNNRDKVLSVITSVLKTTTKLTGLDKYLDDIKVLICLVKDYADKKYTTVPKKVVIAIISLFLYLINPLDLIPDAIPVIGSLDDIAICGFALKFIKSDLEAYKDWKRTQL